MPEAHPPQIVNRETDVLYRKVNPGQWNTETNRLEPTAFQDPGRLSDPSKTPGLSFFVKRYCSAFQVLRYFGSAGATKRQVGVSSTVLPTRMYEHGYRIAEIPAKAIQELGLEYRVEDGYEIDSKGHVVVVNGQNFAIRFLRHARILSEAETLSR